MLPVGSCTTVDALRKALVSAIACSVEEVQETIGNLTVATAAELTVPATVGPGDRSTYDVATRSTVLLADRIPADEVTETVAAEITRWHGRRTAMFVLGEHADEHGVISRAEFNTRAHKALKDAWPLVQKGTIATIKDSIRALTENPPGHLVAQSSKLIFAIQDAWPYVHAGPGQTISLARLALQKEFVEIMRSEIPRGSAEDPDAYLSAEYDSYVTDVAEGDPMEFDDWLAGSDIPVIVRAREQAKALKGVGSIDKMMNPDGTVHGLVEIRCEQVNKRAAEPSSRREAMRGETQKGEVVIAEKKEVNYIAQVLPAIAEFTGLLHDKDFMKAKSEAAAAAIQRSSGTLDETDVDLVHLVLFDWQRRAFEADQMPPALLNTALQAVEADARARGIALSPKIMTREEADEARARDSSDAPGM